ncbi:hypothetical protein CAMGR0001_1045 [Campylobacter gracilis RM3268]|uniref:Uncharacterized protein n=1 Tax=Campylobacter gracilis RM3268 TaxID=553220 RepID=C8PGQ0_9BACT|nr:hypothetical protein CAMGR0001_1045 [Campylobacter gracilis RM3268]
MFLYDFLKFYLKYSKIRYFYIYLNTTFYCIMQNWYALMSALHKFR